MSQAELTKTVIGNVMKALSEPKTQKDVLAEAVAEVERELFPTLYLLLLTRIVGMVKAKAV